MVCCWPCGLFGSPVGQQMLSIVLFVKVIFFVHSIIGRQKGIKGAT